MFIFLFFLTHLIQSIAPSSLPLTDLHKVEFLRSLFQCHKKGCSSMDCHAFSGVLNKKSLAKNYDSVARYHVRGNIPHIPMAQVQDLPENGYSDYWVIIIHAGNDGKYFYHTHSMLFYKGLLIEKRGEANGVFHSHHISYYKYERWMNLQEAYFFDFNKRYIHPYIYLEVYAPKKHLLSYLAKRSSLLEFILKEHILLNNFLRQSQPILKKYSTIEDSVQENYILGWKEALDQGIVSKFFPDINPQLFKNSLDEYTPISFQIRRPLQCKFVYEKRTIILTAYKKIEKFA